MRIVAPAFACPLWRPFGVRGEQRLGMSVLSAWTLEGAPLPAQELWKRFMRAAGSDAVLDQAIPKSASEWLLVGHAHAPQPVTELVAGVETPGGYKAVSVVGDRTWRGGVPTAPETFTKMPLDWSRAFGGEGFAHNPLGRGFTTGDPEGVALPNVELHGRMIASPSDRPEPAGFGAFGIDWPQRTEGLGTYDRRWFERDYPGFAADIDWRVHNVAPLDQRMEAELQPGQRFVLHNLMEGRPRVEVALPEVVARCFVYGDEEAPAPEEIALSLRTVWFVPDEDMMVLVATGSRRVESPLASDLAGILVGLDWSALPRGREHWSAALAARLDKSEDGVVQALDDGPLMPDGIHFPDLAQQAEDLTLPERSGALEANLHEAARRRREEALRAFTGAGFEGGEELFPEPPPPRQPSSAPLGEQDVQSARRQAKEQQDKAREQLAKLRQEARATFEAAGFDPELLDAGPKPGPPPILASTQLEILEEAVREGRAAGLPTEVFERQLGDPTFHRQLIDQEHQGREAYRRMAHHQEALPEEPPEDVRSALRERVEAAIRDRTSLSEADLTCADLNELDLSGMDLRGAWLEGAELSKANLTGALLERAVLAKADLTDAVLDNTVLRYANLGRSRLLFTRLQGCDLAETILAHANLRAASFVGCDLHGADLSEARFERTRFASCDLSGATLFQMSLAGVELADCALAEATLVEVTLDGVAFHRCDLSQAALVTCSGAEVRFDEARLVNARFVAGCVFDGADFRGADLSRATLRGVSLEGADFSEAALVGADLSEARCASARLERADMRRVLATECELRGAGLRGANLMESVLQGADLRGADLSHTNLFGADLALVRGDDATTLEGALTTRMRVRPLRPAGSIEVTGR
ncbi:MAG TPA: DUF2169 domain-containing protein [Sandaracinaceae bacterium LLY-WYZ-13_1]|nr:DUF2169 domain-containing protein [Sandaracinaceae bacterium LLY-WYZ-13_1]